MYPGEHPEVQVPLTYEQSFRSRQRPQVSLQLVPYVPVVQAFSEKKRSLIIDDHDKKSNNNKVVYMKLCI